MSSSNFSFPPPPPPPPKATSEYNNSSQHGPHGPRPNYQRGGSRGRGRESYSAPRGRGNGRDLYNRPTSNRGSFNDNYGPQRSYGQPSQGHPDSLFASEGLNATHQTQGGGPGHFNFSQSAGLYGQYPVFSQQPFWSGPTNGYSQVHTNATAPQPQSWQADKPSNQVRKREFTGAIKPQHNIPRPKAAPAVPQFGSVLPSAEAISNHGTQELKKKPRKYNKLGLTPRTEEHEESEEDLDEEAIFARSVGDGHGSLLRFTYRGQTSTLATATDIATWIAERKKRFPTKDRITQHEKEREQARLDRIQRIQEERERNIARREDRLKEAKEKSKAALRDKRAKEKSAKETKRSSRKTYRSEKEKLAEERDKLAHAMEELARKEARLNQLLAQAEGAAAVSPDPPNGIEDADPSHNNSADQRISRKDGSMDLALPKDRSVTESKPFDSLVTVQEAGLEADVRNHSTAQQINDESENDLTSETSDDSTSSSDLSSSEEDGEEEKSDSDSDDETSSSKSASEGSLQGEPDEVSSRQNEPGFRVPFVRENKQTRLCKEFLSKGKCQRQDCRFLHEKRPGKSIDLKSDHERPKRKGLYQRMMEDEEEKRYQFAFEVIEDLASRGLLDKEKPAIT